MVQTEYLPNSTSNRNEEIPNEIIRVIMEALSFLHEKGGKPRGSEDSAWQQD